MASSPEDFGPHRQSRTRRASRFAPSRFIQALRVRFRDRSQCVGVSAFEPVGDPLLDLNALLLDHDTPRLLHAGKLRHFRWKCPDRLVQTIEFAGPGHPSEIGSDHPYLALALRERGTKRGPPPPMLGPTTGQLQVSNSQVHAREPSNLSGANFVYP